jgi:hypothetical protein
MAECPICKEDLNDPSQTIKQLTTCPHAFHTNCIDTWILTQGHSRCPICRVDVSPAQFSGLAVENIADPVLQAQLRQAEELSRAGGGGASMAEILAGGGAGGGHNNNLQAALNASRAMAAAEEAREAANLQAALNASGAAFGGGAGGGAGAGEEGENIQRGIAASLAQQGWTCPNCTFINNDAMPYCEICQTPRPGGGGGTRRRKRKQRGGSQKMLNVLTKLSNNRQKIKNMKNNTLRLLKKHANSTRRKPSNRSRR